MSQTVEQIEVTWASDDRSLLEIAVAALPTVGVAATPITRVDWNNTVSYAVRISSTVGSLVVPAGIRTEAAPVAGVFMQGPAAVKNVSLRALLRAMTAAGFITKAEALAAARTGDIPISLRAALFAAVDTDTQFEIELAWAAMYEAERSSPFWGFVVTAGIATTAQIDDVFALARTL